MLTRFLAPLAALILIAAPAVAPAQPKAAATDWTRTITLTPNGAYVIGDPKAATRLVEYLSYTCPHCGAFQAEGVPGLKAQWVKRGLVALEYRNFVRDPYDLAAAMLARCGGAARFLTNHEALFANQKVWLKAAEADEHAHNADEDRIAEITRIADKTGLFALLAKRGLSPAAQRKCLADKQQLAIVLNLTAGAWDNKEFTGTPFFILNGKPLADVHAWAPLQPLLPALPATGK
jgi:protein-disulfide isomerase